VIEHAVGHDADFHQFMLYTPLPGTPLYAQLEVEGALRPEAEAPLADRHGQQAFAHRHPHIGGGQEKRYLELAFQLDYEVNGPSVLRAIRTSLAGWKRYRNDPRPGIRERFARAGCTLPTVQAGALWAGIRYCRDNPAVVAKLTAVLEGIYAEFGLKARLAAPFFGRNLLRGLRREAKFLAGGGTYEPGTIYERTRACGDDAPPRNAQDVTSPVVDEALSKPVAHA
jgi:hypothetical protein